MIRRDVIYQGRVQGVGFRWTTNRLARDFAVSGTVENRSDGSVYMVVEGTQREIDQFMEAIATRMSTNIKSTSIQEGIASKEFQEFRVNY